MGKKIVGTLLCAAALLLLLAGCAREKDPLCGDWAYNHDPKTAVLTLEDSGKAAFDGESFRWKRCEGGLELTGADGRVVVHRCVEEKDRILFYIPTAYEAVDAPAGLVGRWRTESGLSFEFTAKGTFLEDGVLPGHYYVDEAAGTIKLAYNDPLEDTLLYYAISDGRLLVEYPWPMVRVE